MKTKELETFYPATRQEWRQWLTENHRLKQSVWLVFFKKKSLIPTLTYSDAVDEALCFGWIDSTRKSMDSEMFIQFFSRRKPKGTWSKINKEKIKQLIDAGLMTQTGYECIENAKQNGSWTILDDVEDLVLPKDLEEEFQALQGSKDFFLSLSKSVRKNILQWVSLAKRPETRQKRISEIVRLAAQKLKPKHIN